MNYKTCMTLGSQVVEKRLSSQWCLLWTSILLPLRSCFQFFHLVSSAISQHITQWTQTLNNPLLQIIRNSNSIRFKEQKYSSTALRGVLDTQGSRPTTYKVQVRDNCYLELLYPTEHLFDLSDSSSNMWYFLCWFVMSVLDFVLLVLLSYHRLSNWIGNIEYSQSY